MYENYKQQIHGAIFITCTIFALISPSYNTTIVQAETGKTNTGKVATRLDAPIQSSGEVDRKKELRGFKDTSKLEDGKTIRPSSENTSEGSGLDKVIQESCGVDCKQKHLEDIGIISEIAESLVTNCKAIADDPRKCILVGASIVTAESGGGKNCRKNNKYNCFGIMQNNNYKSYNDATLHFAGKFQKWWRNAKSMEFFYPKRGEVSPSRFCTSEHSSNSSKGCENGLKNSSAVFNKLSKLF